MNVLVYYSTELLRRSPRSELLAETFIHHGHQSIAYAADMGPLASVVPFTPDVVITRLSHSATNKDYTNLHMYAAPKINTVHATCHAADKREYYQILSLNKVPVPPFWIYSGSLRNGMEKFTATYGFPVVGKEGKSSQGNGVHLLENRQDVLDFQGYAQEPVLLQRFVRESAGRHVRCVVVGDEIVATHENRSTTDDFRSNGKRGATITQVACTDEMAALARAVTGTMKLEIAGIDMLYAETGLQVCDVNATPGLRYLQEYLHVDAATSIVRYAEKKILG